MNNTLAYCGIDCGKCPAYIAKQEDNDELRRQFAEKQGKLYDITIDPATINCDGCRSTGEHLGYCAMCEIRTCCNDRGLETCAMCDDYICETLDKVYTYMKDVLGKTKDNEAEAKLVLDRIRQERCGGK